MLKALTKSSHLEADLISLSPCRQSVDKLVLLTCQQWEIYALRRNISIAYEECGLDCLFDMKWTLEALGNVLDNAIKYSPKGSRIGISATPYEMFLRIDVKDNGLGIEQAEQGLIFYTVLPLHTGSEGKGSWDRTFFVQGNHIQGERLYQSRFLIGEGLHLFHLSATVTDLIQFQRLLRKLQRLKLFWRDPGIFFENGRKILYTGKA